MYDVIFRGAPINDILITDVSAIKITDFNTNILIILTLDIQSLYKLD